MSLNKENIFQINSYFKTKPVLKAYLFGSQLTEKATTDSDIDILVELDYSKKIGLEFFQMQIELEELLNKKVDLVSSEGISKYIKPSVDLQKKLIYAR